MCWHVCSQRVTSLGGVLAWLYAAGDQPPGGTVVYLHQSKFSSSRQSILVVLITRCFTCFTQASA